MKQYFASSKTLNQFPCFLLCILTEFKYTLPSMKNYYSCETIFNKIWECEKNDPDGLGGHIMLIHLGTEDGRTDKFYNHLPELIEQLKAKGYTFTPLRPE